MASAAGGGSTHLHCCTADIAFALVPAVSASLLLLQTPPVPSRRSKQAKGAPVGAAAAVGRAAAAPPRGESLTGAPRARRRLRQRRLPHPLALRPRMRAGALTLAPARRRLRRVVTMAVFVVGAASVVGAAIAIIMMLLALALQVRSRLPQRHGPHQRPPHQCHRGRRRQ